MAIINDKSQTDLSGLYVVYNGSTLNEDPNTYGLAHAMEHLMCKSFEHLYDEFDRYSINWNAYTSNTEVVFFITGLEEYLYKFRHEYVNSLLKFNIKEEEFNTERDVVIQEYQDTFNNQSESHYYNLLRKHYGNYGPIGKLDCLKSITYKETKDYFKKFLSSPSKIINVSKNTKFEGFNTFSNNYPKKFTPSDKDYPIEKLNDFYKTSIIGHKLITKDFAKVNFLASILAGSLNAPLSYEIREKRGLTYGVSAEVDPISETEGVIMTRLITTDEKVSEVMDIYKMVLDNPEKYVTEERFNITRDQFIANLKKRTINRYANVEKHILPSEWVVENIINDLKYQDIMDIYKGNFLFDDLQWSIDKKDIYK